MNGGYQKDWRYTWNRTVNTARGPGRIIEADIVNEFPNKEIKGLKKNISEKIKFKKVLAALLICIIFSILDSLGDAGGNITDETVARHSQMVGSFGQTLDKFFSKSC